MKIVLILLIFLPLLGASILAVAGRSLPRRAAEAIACLAAAGSLAMAVTAFVSAGEKVQTVTFWRWFAAGDFTAALSVLYDPLAAVMALMVTFVSTLILLYSVPFMRDDEDYVRFFCYMDLFVFAMLTVTLADNVLFLYLGWEGVGFCSYALIGFWYRDEFNALAGRKAFIVTRIGDAAFGVAIALFFLLDRTLSVGVINARAGSLSAPMASALGFLLLWAAVGKSAQLPLAVWLPDAMAGPTPVSALIHAATMVTAGVYLLMRFFPVVSLAPDVLLAVAAVGAITSLFAALGALGQRDIKRILAYSTISQVSYMFLGVGAGDIAGGMFHLLAHAFFKALLFLGAGCIIQALHEEHDIFRMGGLRERLPSVFWPFLIGALCLAAIPPMGGFFSKDRILLAAFSHAEPIYKLLWLLGVATAFLTPLYTFRLFFVAFLKRPSTPQAQEARGMRPVPAWMVLLLWPLAILAAFAGLMNLPGSSSAAQRLARFLSPLPEAIALRVTAASEGGMEIGMAVLALAALGTAYLLYRPGRIFAAREPRAAPAGLENLFFSGFYLDRLYEIILVRPYQAIARSLWVKVDEGAIDEGIDQTRYVFPYLSAAVRLWTTGRISTYLKMILLGFTALLCAIVLGWYGWK